jgi:hypothetical protein
LDRNSATALCRAGGHPEGIWKAYGLTQGSKNVKGTLSFPWNLSWCRTQNCGVCGDKNANAPQKKEALAGEEEGFALAHRNLGLHGIALWFFLFLRKLLHR